MPTVTSGGSSNAWEGQDELQEAAVEPELPVLEQQEVQHDEVEQTEVEEVAESEEEASHDEPKAAEVRAWALGNDIDVNSRGAIPSSVMDAYLAAHQEV